MENKAAYTYIRTGKGEDEAHGKTSHLAGDVRRALLMVDGSSTFEEIKKRAAPSLRSSLNELFESLEKNGFIQHQQPKDKSGTASRATVSPRMAMPSGMVVPPKVITPQISQDGEGEELDFMSGFRNKPAKVEESSGLSVNEKEEKSRQDVEAEKLQAQQGSEAMRLMIEQEMERLRSASTAKVNNGAESQVRASTGAKEKQEAEAARLKAESEAKSRTEEMAKQEIEATRLRLEQEVEAARLKAESEARTRAEAMAKQEIEAARLKLEREAEAVRLKAESEAKARAEELAKQEIEAAKLKLQQEAETIRLKAEQEAEAARLKAESEARVLAEMIARQEIEAAKLKLQQEVEDARLKAEQEAAKAREEAAANLKARQRAEEMLIKSVQNSAQAKGQETGGPRDVATTTRTTIATVLFFDVVGYTKQSVSKQIEIKKQFNDLVSECLRVGEDGGRIILDTGDGAAIGFLHHPEDALEVAIKFRKTVVANQHRDYPELKVRIGIHLGPINIAKDMNGRSNMVGDGINDAQRVMSFADTDQIYISRPYHDFVSRLKEEYAEKLHYRGMKADKHGREHPVYEFTEFAAPVVEVQPNPFASFAANVPAAKPGAFAFDTFQVGEQQPSGGLAGGGRSGQTPAPTGASGFAFDSFQGDVSQPQINPKVAQQQSQPVANISAPSGGQAAAPGREQTQQAAQQARIAAEQHAAAEAEAKKRADERAAAEAKRLADEQAKVWADAEQRASEAAKANAARAVYQAEQHIVESTPASGTAPVTRTKRKSSFSLVSLAVFLFKLSLFLWVLLVAALFAVPYFLPMRDYMPKVQEMISARLHQPVHLGYLSGRMLPTPRLELGEIYIGDAKQFQAAQAYLNFSLNGLFGDDKPIDSIDFQGVKVRGMGLQKASSWLQQLASDPKYPVARMTISQGTLDADAFELSGIEGDLDFDRSGKFIQARLRGNAGKYSMGLTADTGKKLQISIKVHGGELPLLPNWTFDDLTAKGELNNAGLEINSFDARIMGGTLQGKASINWNSGWRAQGTMTGKKITMKQFDHLLDGNVDGEGRFQMSSSNLAKLAESVTFDGSFHANDGIISGMDIIETARRHSREHLPGGRTPFDELSGTVSYSDNTYHFKQTKVAAKMLNATATFDVAKQQISGNMNVNLSIQDAAGTTDLQVGGTTDSPTLRYAP